MCFAHGKEGIGHGCPAGSFVGAGKQVVLPAQSHWTDSIFYQVIVDLKVSIMQVAAQLLPALGAIGDRLSHQTLAQHLCCLPVHQPAHLVENWQGLLPARPLYLVQLLYVDQSGLSPLAVLIKGLLKVSPGMGPAPQMDHILCAANLLIGAISVSLQIPFKSLQYPLGSVMSAGRAVVK